MTVTVSDVLATQLRLSCGHFIALQRRGSHQGLLGATMACRQCEGLKPFVWAKPRLAPRADKRVMYRWLTDCGANASCRRGISLGMRESRVSRFAT